MSTDPGFVDYVVDQSRLGGRLSYRKMFGEYGFYLDGKFVGMACDDSFFVKPTDAVARLGLDLPLAPPYPGATPHPVADEVLDDPDRLARLLLETAARLPEPRAKTPRRSRGRKR